MADNPLPTREQILAKILGGNKPPAPSDVPPNILAPMLERFKTPLTTSAATTEVEPQQDMIAENSLLAAFTGHPSFEQNKIIQALKNEHKDGWETLKEDRKKFADALGMRLLNSRDDPSAIVELNLIAQQAAYETAFSLSPTMGGETFAKEFGVKAYQDPVARNIADLRERMETEIAAIDGLERGLNRRRHGEPIINTSGMVFQGSPSSGRYVFDPNAVGTVMPGTDYVYSNLSETIDREKSGLKGVDFPVEDSERSAFFDAERERRQQVLRTLSEAETNRESEAGKTLVDKSYDRAINRFDAENTRLDYAPRHAQERVNDAILREIAPQYHGLQAERKKAATPKPTITTPKEPKRDFKKIPLTPEEMKASAAAFFDEANEQVKEGIIKNAPNYEAAKWRDAMQQAYEEPSSDVGKALKAALESENPPRSLEELRQSPELRQEVNEFERERGARLLLDIYQKQNDPREAAYFLQKYDPTITRDNVFEQLAVENNKSSLAKKMAAISEEERLRNAEVFLQTWHDSGESPDRTLLHRLGVTTSDMRLAQAFGGTLITQEDKEIKFSPNATVRREMAQEKIFKDGLLDLPAVANAKDITDLDPAATQEKRNYLLSTIDSGQTSVSSVPSTPQFTISAFPAPDDKIDLSALTRFQNNYGSEQIYALGRTFNDYLAQHELGGDANDFNSIRYKMNALQNSYEKTKDKDEYAKGFIELLVKLPNDQNADIKPALSAAIHNVAVNDIARNGTGDISFMTYGLAEEELFAAGKGKTIPANPYMELASSAAKERPDEQTQAHVRQLFSKGASNPHSQFNPVTLRDEAARIRSIGGVGTTPALTDAPAEISPSLTTAEPAEPAFIGAESELQAKIHRAFDVVMKDRDASPVRDFKHDTLLATLQLAYHYPQSDNAHLINAMTEPFTMQTIETTLQSAADNYAKSIPRPEDRLHPLSWDENRINNIRARPSMMPDIERVAALTHRIGADAIKNGLQTQNGAAGYNSSDGVLREMAGFKNPIASDIVWLYKTVAKPSEDQIKAIIGKHPPDAQRDFARKLETVSAQVIMHESLANHAEFAVMLKNGGFKAKDMASISPEVAHFDDGSLVAATITTSKPQFTGPQAPRRT